MRLSQREMQPVANQMPMHTIRLRRPWMRSIPGQPTPEKVDVPDDSSVTVDAGTVVQYQRSFNRPTGLGPDDTIWILIESYRAQSIEVRLNDHPLDQTEHTADGSVRVNVTNHLAPSNRLELQLTADAIQPGLLDGLVSLQIDSASQ